MPVHDWSKVGKEEFTSFRQSWLVAISSMLNQSLLPSPLYSMIEQRTCRLRKHWPSLEEQDDESDFKLHIPYGDFSDGPNTIFASKHPPQVGHVGTSKSLEPLPLDRVGIYDCDGDLLLSYVEILAPLDFEPHANFRKLINSFEEMLQEDCKLLVIDLIQHRSSGTHYTFWSPYVTYTPGVTKGEPYGVSGYNVFSDMSATAYFERIAVGQNLPVMPLFLTSEEYINLPLQETYDEAWRGVPARWKTVLEAPKTP